MSSRYSHPTRRAMPRRREISRSAKLISAIRNKQVDKVRSLLKKGADPNYFSEENGQYALFFAFTFSDVILEMLIDHPDIDLTVVDGDGKNILHHVASYGLNDIIVKLLAKGMDVNHQDDHEGTPLKEAIEGGHLLTARLLITNGATFENDDVEIIIANYDHNPGSFETFRAMVNCRKENGYEDIESWLVCSVETSNVEVFEYLLTTFPEWTKIAMGYRADHQLTLLHLTENIDIARKLIDYININVIDDRNRTVLHIAVDNDMVEMIRFLLEYGIDETIKNNDGLTAEELAIQYDNTSIEIFKEWRESATDVKGAIED